MPNPQQTTNPQYFPHFIQFNYSDVSAMLGIFSLIEPTQYNESENILFWKLKDSLRQKFYYTRFSRFDCDAAISAIEECTNTENRTPQESILLDKLLRRKKIQEDYHNATR